MFALSGEEHCTIQDAAKIIRVSVYSIIHHHSSSISEVNQHLFREVNMMFINTFRFQSRLFKNWQRYKLI